MFSMNRSRSPLGTALVLALTIPFVLGMEGHFLSLSGHASDGLPEYSCSLHHGLASVQGQSVQTVEHRDCRIETHSFNGEWLLTVDIPHPPKCTA